MKKNSQRIWLLILMIMTTPIYGLQEISIADNETGNAKLSIKGLTRIAVYQDRIINVRGPEGVYQIQNDNSQGAVFIEPVSEQKNIFTIFVATEKNHNYVIRLNPQLSNADTILLKPRDSKVELNKEEEKYSAYTQLITDLIANMAAQKSLDDYAAQDFKLKSINLDKFKKQQLIKIYQGSVLRGFVYLIKNRTKESLKISEMEFYQQGDRAISLSHHILAPTSYVLLFKVRDYE